jgi:hypothetical protein
MQQGPFKKAVEAERFFLNLDSFEANKKIKEYRLKLIATFENYIHELENIHQKYIHMANSAGHGSKIMAAYLLFSRVIATLKLCCLAQKHDCWYWGSLLREIDEHLALAEYFVIHGDTQAGRTDLLRWYRQNYTPTHDVCRKAISKNMSSIDEAFSESENYGLIDELYKKKSKLTHPTYLVIREITPYKTLPNGQLVVEKVEYGSCNYQRKHLEFTEFFKSHILSSFCTFRQCFHSSPLAEEDLKTLRDVIQKLNEEETIDYLNRNLRP